MAACQNFSKGTPVEMKRKIRRGGATVTIANRSAWPDGALAVLLPWICRNVGIDRPYHFLARQCTNGRRSGMAYGWRKATIRMDRHYRRWRGFGFFTGPNRRATAGRMLVGCVPLWPWTNQDARYQWSQPFTYRTRFEMFVDLIAHEARHATDENMKIYAEKGRASGEDDANREAVRIVKLLRAQWPSLRPKIYAECRKQRRQARRRQESQAARKGSEAKLSRARANMERWEATGKKAVRMAAKYRRRVRYYEQRIAAKVGGNV